MTITVIKAVLVIVIMAVMILLLLAINHIFSGNFNSSQSDTDRLREDVSESEEVITGESAFREFVRVRKRSGERRHALQSRRND